jgi:5-methylcytosine-specific restriction enzyme subunit McrC
MPEYGRINRSDIDNRVLRRLQAFDEMWAGDKGQCVFDWSRSEYIRAQNYVGVVQIPGLVVEILPKIDATANIDDGIYQYSSKQKVLSQRNLLYMLTLTGSIPVRDRDLARLRLQKMTLLEAVTLIFAERLLQELHKGIDREYVYNEKNAHCFKGKLLIKKQITHNVAHKERVYIGYEEFISDTWINRIFKETCKCLMHSVTLIHTQKCLREATMYLSDVNDIRIHEHHFENLHLNRNTERFRILIDFCRIVLTQYSPSPSQGNRESFSLLFPMDKLFEAFIARFILKNYSRFNLMPDWIHIQARHRKKWLLKAEDGKGRFRLLPDIIIDDATKKTEMVIDTKWKRLEKKGTFDEGGVSQSDLYQMFAYASRYNSLDNILLYPKIEGAGSKVYFIPRSDSKIRLEFINLNRDLYREKEAFIKDLQCVIGVTH